MAKLSRRRIAALLATADRASTAAEKGRLFEDLAVLVFEAVPGIRLSVRNAKNAFDSEEVDVAFWNEQHAQGFKALGPLLLVECKNWSSPVGSADVNWFVTKVRNRSLDFGILVAAHGVTGGEADRRQAHDVISKALADGIRVIVITRSELTALTSGADLVAEVKRKLCELIAYGTVWP